jgi:hypothetical protein
MLTLALFLALSAKPPVVCLTILARNVITPTKHYLKPKLKRLLIPCC